MKIISDCKDPTQPSKDPPVVKDYIWIKCSAISANGDRSCALLGTESISFQSFYSSIEAPRLRIDRDRKGVGVM